MSTCCKETLLGNWIGSPPSKNIFGQTIYSCAVYRHRAQLAVSRHSLWTLCKYYLRVRIPGTTWIWVVGASCPLRVPAETRWSNGCGPMLLSSAVELLHRLPLVKLGSISTADTADPSGGGGGVGTSSSEPRPITLKFWKSLRSGPNVQHQRGGYKAVGRQQ